MQGAILKEKTLDVWGEVFRKCRSTPFLYGQGSRGWRADFDWITKNADNAERVLEGKYDGEGKEKGKGGRYSMFAGV